MQTPLVKTSDRAPLGSTAGRRHQVLPEREPSDPFRPAAALSNTGWEVVLGRILGLADSAQIFLELPGTTAGGVKARTVVAITQNEVGRQAVVAFEGGDPTKPIVLGVIATAEKSSKVTLNADGEKFVVLAEKEIELRCGKASIVLTRAGKVLIKGEYVLTRARGLNRIKGAAVSIN